MIEDRCGRGRAAYLNRWSRSPESHAPSTSVCNLNGASNVDYASPFCYSMHVLKYLSPDLYAASSSPPAIRTAGINWHTLPERHPLPEPT